MKRPFFSDLKTPIAIVGMGVTGNAVLKLLIADGVRRDDIVTFDEKSVDAQYNIGSDLLDVAKANTLVVSPGVPLVTPWIDSARKKGIKITSELSLASRILTTEKIIAITGSLGKSTTTCILRAALERFCPSFFVGGNLGIPLAEYACDLLSERRKRAEWVVLELSSYQLENFPELKANYSIITFLTSNHLERYESKQDYYQTKWNIEKFTERGLILNKNGGELGEWANNQKGLIPWIWTSKESPLIPMHSLDKCALLGSHNLDNLAMAAEIATLEHWPASAFDGMRSFPGLSHRVENLGLANNVRFINDSKATTMESVRTAVNSSIESVPPSNNLHLLLGGKDKNLPWEELASLNQFKQIKFYFFGKCKDIAKEKSGLSGNTFSNLHEATSEAFASSRPGDSILLSPGGTSLDEFKNFEARGEKFKADFEEFKNANRQN